MSLKSREKVNILVAYPYCNNRVATLLEKYQSKVRILIDSGAFTSWSKGKAITVDEYCSFIRNLPFKPWKYFMLDGIGDSEKTFLQYNQMLDKGFSPIPIFTQGEKIERIDKYYETSDVLGIGSLVGTKGNLDYVGMLNGFFPKFKEQLKNLE